MCYETQKGRTLTYGHTGKVEINLFTVYALDGASTVVVSNITWKEVTDKGYDNLSKFDCMRTSTKLVWASEA
jgi:hypothetical protein